MFWPEQVGGKFIISRRKVGACKYDFSSEFSAFHAAFLHPAGAGHHGVIMIDSEEKILKLIVFFHGTKVFSEQSTGQEFTSGGICLLITCSALLTWQTNTSINLKRASFHPTLLALVAIAPLLERASDRSHVQIHMMPS